MKGKPSQPVRAYFSVQVPKSDDGECGGKVYVGVERVSRDDGLREQIVARALREADSWRERYQQYAELAEIAGAIARTVARVENGRAKRAA